MSSKKSSDERQKFVDNICRKYNKELVSYARKKVFLMRGKDSVTEAEDVVQNTYVRLLKYLPDCAKIKNEKAYVFSILHNELYNCMNNSKVDYISESDEEYPDSFDLDEYVINKISAERVGFLISHLDYNLRAPMVLKYGYDLNVEEIANQLGIDEKTVYYRLQKARKIIAEELNESKWG